MMCIHLYRKLRQNPWRQCCLFVFTFLVQPSANQTCRLLSWPNCTSLSHWWTKPSTTQGTKKTLQTRSQLSGQTHRCWMFTLSAGCRCDWQVVGLVALADGAGRPAPRQAVAPLQVQRLLWPESQSKTPDTDQVDLQKSAGATCHSGTTTSCFVLVRRSENNPAVRTSPLVRPAGGDRLHRGGDAHVRILAGKK